MHFIGQQTAIVALMEKRLVEISRSRTERAVGEGLEGADTQVRPTKGTADSEFCQFLNVSDGRSRIDPRGQLVALQQFAVDGDVVIAGNHVLDASNAHGRRISERPLND